MNRHQYDVIRGGAAGRRRLQLVAEVFGHSTRTLLDLVDVPEGSSCLDVGCGGGDVSFELARRTGTSGQVVGVDFDRTKLELAEREAERRQLPHLRFEYRDVAEWNSEKTFDLVYARFLLSHLADPEDLLAALRRNIRPGGAIVIEDVDFRGHFSDPPSLAFDRYVSWYTTAVEARGANPNIGPRLPHLLRAAGFDDVQLSIFQPVAMQGGIKHLSLLTMEYITEAVLEDAIASERELRETIDELAVFVSNPDTLIGGPRVVQAWAR